VAWDVIRFSADYLRQNHDSQHWKWLATVMLTGEASLRTVYYRDGLQKQAYEEVLSFFNQAKSPSFFAL